MRICDLCLHPNKTSESDAMARDPAPKGIVFRSVTQSIRQTVQRALTSAWCSWWFRPSTRLSDVSQRSFCRPHTVQYRHALHMNRAAFDN